MTTLQPTLPPSGLSQAPQGVPRRNPLWLVCQEILQWAFSAMFEFEAYGLENIPPSGPAIIACNHQSYLDPVAVGLHLRRPVAFMAKSGLFRNRYFGALLRGLHAFPVQQGKGDRAAIGEALRQLHSGNLFGIFPEGSRSLDGKIARLQGGVALILRRAAVPVIPAVVDGTYEAWPATAKLPRPGKVRILYGPPLQLHQLAAADCTTELERIFRVMFNDLRQFPPGGTGQPLTASQSPARPELILPTV